jgi:hypothetical protein
VTPRDSSLQFESAHAAILKDISNLPGARLIDVDPRNRLAVIEVPTQLSAQVHSTLADRFIVDANATLRY